MTPKLCKYQCGVMLDAWDDDAKKYREAGSGGLHTKERCEEMKAKARTVQGENNNHGNELVQDTIPTPAVKEYVDHTQPAKGQSKVKIFTGSDQFCEEQYNKFLSENNGKIRTQGAQFQINESACGIALYYEETKQ